MINIPSLGEKNRIPGSQYARLTYNSFEADEDLYIDSVDSILYAFDQPPYTFTLSSNTIEGDVIVAPSPLASGTALGFDLWVSHNDKLRWANKTIRLILEHRDYDALDIISTSTTEGKLNWATEAIRLISEHREYDALDIISSATTEAKSRREYGKLAEDLKLFDLKQLPDLLIIALLRNTFSMRQYIEFWPDMLQRAERILRSRKRDPKALLRGLRRKV